MPMSSSPCQTTGKHTNAGDHHPRLCASDGRLKVFGEATVAPEPGEGALNDPTLSLCFECPDALRASDNLDDPLAELGNRVEQFGTAIDAISKDVPQLGKGNAEGFQQRHCTVIVLDVGGMDLHGKQRTVGIGNNVSLTS